MSDYRAALTTPGAGAAVVTSLLARMPIAMIGLSLLLYVQRETVNKALADFAHRGWLRLEGKSVLILDPERLARRAR